MFVAGWLCAVRHQMYSERRREMNPATLPSLNRMQLLYCDRVISEVGSTHTHTHICKRGYIDTKQEGEEEKGGFKRKMKSNEGIVCQNWPIFHNYKHTCTHIHTQTKKPCYSSSAGIFDVATFISPPF